jgi:glycosyltransferase involved in cell wall biosynthesis
MPSIFGKITRSFKKIHMPDQFPKISIVTASYNQGAFIEESILSVLEQNYPNLEYVIMDGGSTDNTVEIIKKYASRLAYWQSESDKGLYDALHRGFQKTTGDIMGWLNSDDLLMRKSLFTLAEIFSENSGIEWLQGHSCVADETGRIVFQRPQRYSKYSFYLREYHDGIFIQQESTYWRRELWERAGSAIADNYRLAGDFELWMRFFNYAELYNTAALVGAFRLREGQLSSKNYNEYMAECDAIIDYYLPRLPEIEQAEILKLRKGPSRPTRLLQRLTGTKTVRDKRAQSHFVNFNFEKKCFERTS